ncbi:protein SIEVE ELEMENT OCCLUSION B-like [Cornus florida]|uniref:protein SIEVE ELEMENT OCCLUSION B-like n=1 Tax=Cornus florida TaxID=4283 RepID=UPI0028963B0E|nr:protein SIEVE ELEMENT OCCLUSION B-like [Cornus florida]
MTRCIVEFKDLPYPYIYITKDLPALSTATATIPTAVYWAIKGVAVCADQIINLSTNGHNLQESSELSTLTDMISKILDHLKKQLTTCYQYIEDKKKVDALQHLFELMIHTDKMEVLKAIICPKDDQLPLLDGEKKRANLEILRKKNVSLLISGLEISQEEITELEQIYKDSKKNAYEVVWIPILEHWADSMQEQFESQQTKMPWLSVHPSFIEKPVIWFIKEKWHFRNKPILVVVDAQGKVVNPNAIHMMRIWGSNAFPFTSSKEEALWKEGVWRLELLLHGIDQTILNWVKDGKYIFLYGGDDIKWIREFTKKARNLAENADIPLQMVYLGKSAKREKVPGVIKTIRDEKLSYCWQEMMVTISFFWTRLQSMLFSKIRLGSVDDSEPMMEEIKKILSYDKSGGWAVLTKGSSVVLNGHSSTVLLALSDYDLWKKQIPEKGFDRSIKEYYDKHHGPAHPCCRFDFSSTLGWIPENMTCPECRRNMEKHFAFVCCHDESAASAQY